VSLLDRGCRVEVVPAHHDAPSPATRELLRDVLAVA
jgi:hypothetical protein